MNNVEIVLAVIVIAAILVILNYLLDDRPISDTPFLTGATIIIKDKSNNVPNKLWYSDNSIPRTFISTGIINPIVLHSNTLLIGIDTFEELQITEMPNNLYVKSINIVINNYGSAVCSNDELKLTGTAITTSPTMQLTVKDINSGQETSISQDHQYSNCFLLGDDECANIEFNWPNVGSVGLKIKKRVKNSNTQINITLTDSDPMIPPNPVYTGTSDNLPGTVNLGG